MRSAILILVGALSFAVSAGAQSSPSARWLAEAHCVHLHEGPWTANTGNGQFGGMQFGSQTWMRLHGKRVPAFAHPGDPAYPFAVSPKEQLHRAWLLWLADGRSWRSWAAAGAACSQSRP